MKTTVPDNDKPLSDTSVSLQLSLIQRRILEILEKNENELELSLVDDVRPKSGGMDPYDHNRYVVTNHKVSKR